MSRRRHACLVWHPPAALPTCKGGRGRLRYTGVSLPPHERFCFNPLRYGASRNACQSLTKIVSTGSGAPTIRMAKIPSPRVGLSIFVICASRNSSLCGDTSSVPLRSRTSTEAHVASSCMYQISFWAIQMALVPPPTEIC